MRSLRRRQRTKLHAFDSVPVVVCCWQSDRDQLERLFNGTAERSPATCAPKQGQIGALDDDHHARMGRAGRLPPVRRACPSAPAETGRRTTTTTTTVERLGTKSVAWPSRPPILWRSLGTRPPKRLKGGLRFLIKFVLQIRFGRAKLVAI
jgi:hypothetical protein